MRFASALALGPCLLALAAGAVLLSQEANVPATKTQPFEKVVKTDAEWKKQLAELQYRVTRRGGTEPSGSGPLLNNKSAGTYTCICCDLPLFSSETKYDACGWPSFYDAIAPNVEETPGGSLEVHCARCDAHLGHVFADGPKPTGLRY